MALAPAAVLVSPSVSSEVYIALLILMSHSIFVRENIHTIPTSILAHTWLIRVFLCLIEVPALGQESRVFSSDSGLELDVGLAWVSGMDLEEELHMTRIAGTPMLAEFFTTVGMFRCSKLPSIGSDF